jgi:hypothetical protein
VARGAVAVSEPIVYTGRAARQVDAATVEVARAAAAKARAEAEAATTEARLRAEEARRQARAAARQAAREERERERARRREARAARLADWRRALAGHGPLTATLAVIALFVGVALPAQIGFLAQRWPLPMALAGGIALEALTWVFALQGRAREARGLSGGVHYAGIWAAAATAAAVNLVHGAAMWGPGFAIVAACGSLAAPVVWHMYLYAVRHDGDRDPKAARLARRRRRHHRKVARLADRIASALPQGLDPDEAWERAWRAVHGAEPGVTAVLLERQAKAAAKVAQLTAPAPEQAPATDPAPAAETDAPALPAPHEPETVAPAPRPRPKRAPRKAAATTAPARGARNVADLLGDARELTADWPERRLSAEALRTALHIKAATARELRDALKAERAAAPAAEPGPDPAGAEGSDASPAPTAAEAAEDQAA